MKNKNNGTHFENLTNNNIKVEKTVQSQEPNWASILQNYIAKETLRKDLTTDIIQNKVFVNLPIIIDETSNFDLNENQAFLDEIIRISNIESEETK